MSRLDGGRRGSGIAVRFRVLGPLEVVRDGGRIEPGSFKQRSLLALLLIHRNRMVSTDRLIDALWGDDVSSDRHNALWVHVSNLRTALDPDRSRGSEGSVLVTRSPGYVLAVDDGSVDAAEFERFVVEGRGLLDSDPGAASVVLSKALALWRGRAYEEFTYESFAQTEIARLAELRLEAVEVRVDADLALGMDRELVSELEARTREHPFRERPVGQLMVALYRSGRQAESLRVYRALRRRLTEELGLDPSAELQRLEQRILSEDPGLGSIAAVARTQTGPGRGLAVRGYELREAVGSGGSGVVHRAFQPAVGREVAIKIMRPNRADDPEFIRRFEAEATLIASMEHPRIVPVYDYWREPGAAYLVMRLMEGGSLADAIADGPIPERQAVRIIGEVAGALAGAHEQGIVHRNIRPANILLDREGRAFVADFGTTGARQGGVADEHGGRPGLYTSPEELAGATTTVRSDVFSLGVVLREMLTGDAEPSQDRATPLLAVADRAASATVDDRHPDASTFAAEVVAASRRPAHVPPSRPLENPYKGLRPFEEGDAATFFGRERLVERVVNRLGQPGRRGRFVALVGPSGSGKSSVIKAGLLPAVRGGAAYGSEDWFVAEMVPGTDPFEELETAMLRVAVDPPSTLLEQLQADERGLRRTVETLLPDHRSHLLLVVDQFEELFTVTRTRQDTDLFLDALRLAVADEPSRMRVVVTLRADFYDRPLRYHRFGELLREGTVPITPMSPEQLERAVAAPAETAGVALEPGLAAAVVADVAEQPSALPLMQYAMTELFERRQGATLTVDAYRDLGGVAAALSKRAEDLFQALGDTTAETARQIFLRLVTLGEGGQDTRRRVLRSQLHAMNQNPEAVDEVLAVYGRHRLLTFDRDPVSRGPTVEVAHEALLREWPRYRRWVDDARSDVRFQRRLATQAAEWHSHGQDPAYLLIGSRLAEAENWAASTDLAVPDADLAYVAESSRHAETSERARRRRRHVLTAVIGAAAAVALALFVFGLTQRSAADRLAEVERINRIVESAEDALDFDPDLSLLLGAAAAEDTQRLGLELLPENLAVLHQGLAAQRLLFSVEGGTNAVFSPDGARAYVTLGDGSISVRDTGTGQEVDVITPASPYPAEAIALSDDGRWLSTGHLVVDTQTFDTVPLTWPSSRLGVIDVDISPDGTLIGIAHFDRGRPAGLLAMWDRASQQELWNREIETPVRVDFDPDGELVAVVDSPADLDTSVLVLDTVSGEPKHHIAAPDHAGTAAFHPDGATVLVGGVGVVRHWHMELESFVATVAGHDGQVLEMDLSRDGSIVASGDGEGVVILRNRLTGEITRLPRHDGAVVRTELNADGTRLATVVVVGLQGPGVLRVFDTTVAGSRDLPPIDVAVPRLANVDIDPSGRLIALAAEDVNGTRQVRTMSGDLVLELPAHQSHGQGAGVGAPIAFSPDGATIATGDATGQIRLWDAGSGELLLARHTREITPELGDILVPSDARDPDRAAVVLTVAFSPDGQHLVIGGAGFVILTDAATLEDGIVLEENTKTLTERIAFSPDGQRVIASSSFGQPPEGFSNRIRIWDTATGAELASVDAGIPGVTSVDHSPTGDHVALGSDEEIRILDPETFEVQHTLETISRHVRDVAFSPNGDVLAAAYGDGQIVMWDPHTGELLYTLSGHDGVAADLDWTDDASRLVSAGSDGSIRIHIMDPGELIALARSRAARPLTTDECHQYLGQPSC